MDQGLVAQAREGTLGGAPVGEGDSWRQWLVGHSLQVPFSRGPSRPLRSSAVGACGAGFTDRVSYQPCAPARFGGSAVRRSQEVPKGVRKEKLDGCTPLFTSPSPLPSYPLEENEGFGFPGSKALLNGTYPLHQEGAVGTDRFLLHYSSLLLETRASPERAPGQEEWVVVAAGLKVELSLKLLPSALRPCLPSKPAHQPPQVHPVTPYLGVTPDEAQLPAGPPAHRGGHIWAVPSPVGSAIWGADFGSGSPWGVGPGLGSFPRGPSYPFLSSSSFPIAVNISTKWKRKKKTKKKKQKRKKENLIT